MNAVVTHQSRLLQENRSLFDPERQIALNLSSASFSSTEIALGRYRLQIPDFIEREMARLDQLICSRNIHSEVGGIGLTARVDSRTSKIVEFLIPKPSIFIAEESFSDKFLAVLENISSTEAVELSLTPKQIRIGFLCEGEIQYHSLPIRDSYHVGSIHLVRELLGLRGIATQDTTSPVELAEVIRSHIGSHSGLAIETRLQAILTMSSVLFTDFFWKAANSRARETELSIGFQMHHHPRIFNWLADSSLAVERNKYFRTLLTLSGSDRAELKRLGIEFCELRALGSPRAPSGFHNHITRRFFRLEV